MLPASSLSLSPPRGPRRTRRVCPTRRFRLKSSRVHRSIDRSHLPQRVYRDSRVTYICSDVVAAATRRPSTWPASDRLTPRFDPPAGNKRERESAFSLFTLLFSLPDFIPNYNSPPNFETRNFSMEQDASDTPRTLARRISPALVCLSARLCVRAYSISQQQVERGNG